MKLTLYTTPSDTNTITKVLQNAKDYTGILRDGADVLNPTIEVSGDNLSAYNYAYIPDFGRYYFISLRNINKNLWELTGTIDPLMSWKSQILNTFVTIDKQEQIANADLYINDDTWICENKGAQQVITFPAGFNESGQFILITAGA